MAQGLLQPGVRVGTGLDLLESAQGARTTVKTPYVWSDDESWKRLVLTVERPFLEGEHYDKWMKGKELYCKLKVEGRV